MVVRITFRYVEEEYPYIFLMDISIQVWRCAHRTDDEMMPYGNNHSLWKHYQSGWALP